jgi:hypothetical protein
MKDVEIRLPDRSTALAEIAEALGNAGVSIEGGGLFAHGGQAVAHFLVADARAASIALSGLGPDASVVVRDVRLTRLDQGTPGTLGIAARAVADGGDLVLAQYSDHDGNLVLVTAPSSP